MPRHQKEDTITTTVEGAAFHAKQFDAPDPYVGMRSGTGNPTPEQWEDALRRLHEGTLMDPTTRRVE